MAPRQFDRYIDVDYSGAQTPETDIKGLSVGAQVRLPLSVARNGRALHRRAPRRQVLDFDVQGTVKTAFEAMQDRDGSRS